MRLIHLPLLLLLSGLSPVSAAGPPLAVAVDQLFGPEDPDYFSGELLVARNGKPLVHKTAGMAEFADSVPLLPDSVFQLASAAKPFTSVAILQLRDQGRLKLDDPVAQHLPGFPYPKITIRHLLTHTSGLPDLELFEPMVAADPQHVVSGKDLVPALSTWQKPVRFLPGEQFRYSNINYQLLAQLVSVVTGRPFGDYVRERIFRPAGMRSSYVLGSRALGPQRAPVANHVHAVMYRTRPEDVRHLDYPDKRMMRPYRYEGFNLGSTVGDQNLFSTVDDLMLFDRALRSGKILSLGSQEEAYAPVRLNSGSEYTEPVVYDLYASICSYGMGWEVCRHPTRGRLVGHAGFNRGIQTMLYRELDSGVFAAMYDNGDTSDFSKKLAGSISTVHGDKSPVLPRQRSTAREYGAALLAEGPTAAMILFNRLRAEPTAWITTKEGMNRLGYDLLRNGHQAAALEPFRINILLYPDDANLYDSLAEALAANDRKPEAILAYKRSLELKPDNEKGRAVLKALEISN